MLVTGVAQLKNMIIYNIPANNTDQGKIKAVTKAVDG